MREAISLDDGPEAEDGPWAEGWEERSGQGVRENCSRSEGDWNTGHCNTGNNVVISLGLVNEKDTGKVLKNPEVILEEHLDELRMVIRSFESAKLQDPERWGSEWLGEKLHKLNLLEDKYKVAIYVLTGQKV